MRVYDERSDSDICEHLTPPATSNRLPQPWQIVRSLQFAADARRLAAAGSDGALRLWDLRAPSTPLLEICPHADSIWALAAADPELRTVYTGGRDGAVRPQCFCCRSSHGL